MLVKLASIIIHNPRAFGISIPVHVVASRGSRITSPARYYPDVAFSKSGNALEQVRPQKHQEESKQEPPKFEGQVFPGEWLVDALRQINFSVALEERGGNENPLFQIRIKPERLGLTRMGKDIFCQNEIQGVLEKLVNRELMIKAHHIKREWDSHGCHKSCILILRSLYWKEIAEDYLMLKFLLSGEKLCVEFPELPVVAEPSFTA